MKTITFYSYKGGLGRTLVVANVARYLSLFRKKVFAVDFDLEAPGLHYKLGLGGKGRRVEKGLVDFIHTFLLGRAPEDLQDYVIEVERKAPSEGSIHLLPAGAVPSSEYWQKLAQINWHDLFYSENPRGIPFFLELKAQIEEEFAPDYLLVDARTGITEVGGVATTLLADTVVCLLLNNSENLEGAREVLRGIQRAPRLPGQAPIQIVPVVARLPELDDRRQEERILEEVRTFLNEEALDLASTLNVGEVLVLHVDSELQLREFVRVGGAQGPEECVLLRDYLRLFDRLIPQEIIRASLEPLIRQVVEKEAIDPDGARKDLNALIRSSYNREICLELARLIRSRLALTEVSSESEISDESLSAGLLTDPFESNSLLARQQRLDRFWVERDVVTRALVFGVDARDLESTGWAVLFAEGCDPALRESLRPLLDHRRSQAKGLYRELTSTPGEDKRQFLARYGLRPGLTDPLRIPYYVLIVGSPKSISFEFQEELDFQYGVGRVCFETLEEYARYARNVVAVESGEVSRSRLISVFSPENLGDHATSSLAKFLVTPLAEELEGLRDNWQVELLTSDAATKSQLRNLLARDRGPALLFAASHGLVFPAGDARQIHSQGALVCQEWDGRAWNRSMRPEFYFSAADVPETVRLQGLITFLYGSFTAGTEAPEDANLVKQAPWSATPFVARLPQRLLGHPSGGALAVIGKTNAGWLSFLEMGGTALFQSAVKLLTDGYPVGAAMDIFSQFSAELGMHLEGREVRDRSFWHAMEEARSFIILGDPAVRLAVAPTPA